MLNVGNFVDSRHLIGCFGICHFSGIWQPPIIISPQSAEARLVEVEVLESDALANFLRQVVQAVFAKVEHARGLEGREHLSRNLKFAHTKESHPTTWMLRRSARLSHSEDDSAIINSRGFTFARLWPDGLWSTEFFIARAEMTCNDAK